MSKDLLARALTYRLQEERLGGVSPQHRRLLASIGKSGSKPARCLKVGCVIVREFRGRMHEVTVIPEGYAWEGQTFSSLSAIARAITGTSWNGFRLFGLQSAPAGVRATSTEKEKSTEKETHVEKASEVERDDLLLIRE